MKEVLFKIIEDISKEKIKSNRTPVHALLLKDIFPQLKLAAEAALIELEREGKIKHCNTINDNAYEAYKSID